MNFSIVWESESYGYLYDDNVPIGFIYESEGILNVEWLP